MVNQMRPGNASKPQKKTAAELLAILNAEAPNFLAVAIVVGFETGDVFVPAADPNRAAALEDAVTKRGGIATGLVGVKKVGDQGTAWCRIFPEYANAPGVPKYLEDASILFASQFAEKS